MFLQKGCRCRRTSPDGSAACSRWCRFVGLRFDGVAPNGLLVPELVVRWTWCLALIAWFAPNTQELMSRYRPVLGQPAPGRLAARFRWLLWRPSYAWGIVVALLSAAALANMWIGDNAEFLYFQF